MPTYVNCHRECLARCFLVSMGCRDDDLQQTVYQDHAPPLSRACILIGPGRLNLDFAFQSAPIYSHIATASGSSMELVQPIVSCVQSNLKVVKVLSENVSKVNIEYALCAKSLQMPSLIAFDY